MKKLKLNRVWILIFMAFSMSATIGCGTLEDVDSSQNDRQNNKTIEKGGQIDESDCMGRVNALEHLELATLSDPNTLVGPYDAQQRINQIAAIFKQAQDPRGLFSTVYRLITNRAVESVEEGDYEHSQWAKNLITEFARRYMANLHGHLTDGEVTGQWKKYYDIAQNCRVGRGRTLGVAIAVHLMVDLPKTLYLIDSQPEQRQDFVRFGDVLLEIFPQLITDVAVDYQTDVRDLLRGFFLGEWVDRFTRRGTMTAFMYQAIRLKAWRDGQNYQHFPRAVVDTEVRVAWGAVEVLLAHLDAVEVL